MTFSQCWTTISVIFSWRQFGILYTYLILSPPSRRITIQTNNQTKISLLMVIPLSTLTPHRDRYYLILRMQPCSSISPFCKWYHFDFLSLVVLHTSSQPHNIDLLFSLHEYHEQIRNHHDSSFFIYQAHT